ncbi:MAG: class I SAM-dependent methyltransferase [Alphaproteobacteria bacterium]|nr:class I SAM-dependent methyltransferase [Alphaproteobacteria bacterium]
MNAPLRTPNDPSSNSLILPLIAKRWEPRGGQRDEKAGDKGYELIDSGHGRKLERYGKIIVDRPEPQALWDMSLPPKEWECAHARFTNSGDEEQDAGKWKINRDVPDSWAVEWQNIRMMCRLMSFRHMGLFPEQQTHWQWVNDQIHAAGRPLNILNLFAYTGAASLSAAASDAGVQVTHVDASKKAIQWAKENQEASGLTHCPIRWICDDAKAFVARELRRGRTYDGIILDPPKFGRGPNGERWQIEEDLPQFLRDCAALLSDRPSFMILTAYAMRLSSISLGAALRDVTKNLGGECQSGELLIAQKNGDRFLSTSLFARWRATA